MDDHYEALGVDKSATPDEIKKAHRRKVRKNHPDKGGDPEKFMMVQRAYEILSDEEKRRRYDNGEPDPPNVIHEAFSYVGGMFNSIVDRADERLICNNVIEQMQMLVAADQQKVKKQVGEWEKKITFLGQVKARLSYKGSRQDILTGILDQQMKSLRGGIKAAEHQTEMLRLAASIVKEYNFEPESPMTSDRARDNFRATFGGGSSPFFGWGSVA